MIKCWRLPLNASPSFRVIPRLWIISCLRIWLMIKLRPVLWLALINIFIGNLLNPLFLLHQFKRIIHFICFEGRVIILSKSLHELWLVDWIMILVLLFETHSLIFCDHAWIVSWFIHFVLLYFFIFFLYDSLLILFKLLQLFNLKP